MKPLQKTYDERANVLYISVGNPKPAVTVPLRLGVLVRADRSTGEFLGVTLVDFDISREHDYEQVLTDSPKVPRELLHALFAQIASP